MIAHTRVVVLALVLAGLLAGCRAGGEKDELSTAVSAICNRTSLGSGAGQSWNWGGGHEYPDIVTPTLAECEGAAITIITPQDENHAQLLRDALNSNPSTDKLIFLDGELDIDLTPLIEDPIDPVEAREPFLVLGERVWLASDRGRIRADGTSSPGAVLRLGREQDDYDYGPLIEVQGDEARITGLRIWGGDPETCSPDPSCEPWCANPIGEQCPNAKPPVAIRVGTPGGVGGDKLEIDNNDIGAWPWAGVQISGAEDVTIHHNYFHHVQRTGGGYPVSVGGHDPADYSLYGASATIDHNRFQFYRHAVASSGGYVHSYTAHDNLALAKSIGRVFDVHEWEHPDHAGSAGGFTEVYSNIILPENYYSFDVRGVPFDGAFFYLNCTARNEASSEPVVGGGSPAPDDENVGTVLQRNVTEAENVTVGTNSYGQKPSECADLRWCVSSGGESPYSYLNISDYGLSDGFAFGDFDGNGKTDVFRHTGSAWRVSFDGTGTWVTVKTDSTPLEDLRFGDFCGDQKTDVFRSVVVPGESSFWQCTPGEDAAGGTWGAWQILRSDFGTIYPVTNLAVGYFDPTDAGPTKKADIFRATGTGWEYRKNGTDGTWTTLASSSAGLADLAFADFNDDGVTDVFHASGPGSDPGDEEWWLYPGGLTPATQLSDDNDLRVFKLHFGDFDADGRTDVMYANGEQWRYKSEGTGDWIQLAVAPESWQEIAVGNFDDDDTHADVFFPGCQ